MNTVTCLFEDASGRLWVGTDLGGLNLLDPFQERSTGSTMRCAAWST